MHTIATDDTSTALSKEMKTNRASFGEMFMTTTAKAPFPKGNSRRKTPQKNTNPTQKEPRKRDRDTPGGWNGDARLLFSDGAASNPSLRPIFFFKHPPVRLLKPAFRPNRKVP